MLGSGTDRQRLLRSDSVDQKTARCGGADIDELPGAKHDPHLSIADAEIVADLITQINTSLQ